MATFHKIQKSGSRQNQSSVPSQASAASETVPVLGSSAEHNTQPAVQNDLATRPAHTPGPWKLAAHVADPCTVYIEQADGEEPGICTTDGSAFTPVDSEDEQEANARLIAAAPELLTALKSLTALIRNMRGDWLQEQPAFANSIAAINKAEGR